jgi:AcrR family transcriptional regulator
MDTISRATQISIEARRLLEIGGMDAVSMRRVAQAVGVTATAIYRHFPDRAALLNGLADEGFRELAKSLKDLRSAAGSTSSRLAKMADVTVDFAVGHPHLYELMFLKPRQGARRYPHDFKAGRSPTASVIAEALREMSGREAPKEPWQIAFEMGALSHGLIMLYLGGRIDTGVARFRLLHRRALRRYLNAFGQ